MATTQRWRPVAGGASLGVGEAVDLFPREWPPAR